MDNGASSYRRFLDGDDKGIAAKQSEINGVSVVIYGYQDTFMVQFSHENINYDIETSNITLEELEDLLIGIIE